MRTTLDAIATANPPITGTQQEAAAFMKRVERLPAPIRNRIEQIYGRSAIDRRYSCVADYTATDPADFTFFSPNWQLQPPPSTAQRNQKYREAILPLVEDVARDAIAQAGLAPSEITHVIAVTCTGFFAPGLDIELVKRLKLPAETQRTVIGFMGCYAAFNGFRVAHGLCQAHPGARVLLVCAELCTLHFQVNDTLESAIVNSLFSDGAAAAILSSRPVAEAEGQLVYGGAHTLLDGDSMDHMSWDIGDTGFLMGLSARVPNVIAHHLPGFVESLLSRHHSRREDVDFWAVHPGGRAIVDKAQAVLGLPAAAVHDSLEVLRCYGNMSSPTILFVLKRFLDQHQAARAAGGDGLQLGVSMAFGPGLTLEGCLWQRSDAA